MEKYFYQILFKTYQNNLKSIITKYYPKRHLLMVSPRNKLAGIIAIIAGILLFISGTAGMVDLLESLHDVIKELMGETNSTIEIVFWVLIFIALLGGIAVIIGGYLIWKDHPIAGKILIILGTSMGLIGLIINLLIAIYNGETGNFLNWLITSFAGIGVIMAIAAQKIAK
jgi:hypothetical protein